MNDEVIKKRVGTIYGLLSKNPDIEKEDVVSSFSNGRTTHVSELTYAEADELINYLQQHTVSDRADKLRKMVLCQFHHLKWYITDKSGLIIPKDGRPQLDYQRIEKFLVEKSPAKKTLNEQSIAELEKTAYQLKQIVYNTLK